jgi:citrate lyase subunit beta/citryl-CoA lyase
MSSSSEPRAGLARSFLFVPGDRPERFAKAAASGAHEVIVDLEDAVAPSAKDMARAAVAAWLFDGGRAVVRINPSSTPWYADDLLMVAQCSGATVMLPKADAACVSALAAALPGRRIIALLETVGGYIGLRELAAAPQVERIAFGSVDFALESGIADEGDALTAVRTRIVLESVHAGLSAPIDGVGVEFQDESRMLADARWSRQVGFGGKLCIHPRQVGPTNAAWRPSEAEIVWARKVLEAFEASGGAATAVDGKMIDKPVVERARRIAAEAAAA